MLGLVVAVLLAGPEDSRALLQKAWDSQYSWAAEGVQTVTLDFVWTVETEMRSGANVKVCRGTIVASPSGVVHLHAPADTLETFHLAQPDRRELMRAVLRGALSRFARPAFTDRFGDSKLGNAEQTKDGAFRIPVYTPSSSAPRYFVVKDGRLTGRERRINDQEYERTRFTLKAAGAHYLVVEASEDSHRQRAITQLVAGESDGVYYPKRHYRRVEGRNASKRSTVSNTIEFTRPRVNQANALVGEVAARDALAAAWQRRYVIPKEAVIEAEFVRTVDEDLSDAGWADKVTGQIHVADGQIRITVTSGGRSVTLRDIKRDFETAWRWLLDRPVEEAFAQARFFFAGGGHSTILIDGCPWALGVKLRDGLIVGYRGNSPELAGWWDFGIIKSGPAPRFKSVASATGMDRKARPIKYVRRSGVYVPSHFTTIGWSPYDVRQVQGVVSYNLRRIKVKTPR